MPHPSHRRRPNPQHGRPHRENVTDANGWTTIQYGPKTPPPPPPPPPPSLETLSLSTSSPTSTSPPPTTPSISSSDLQALKAHYAHHKQLWESSACAATLRSILGERVERNEISKLKNCVVLGLGSLSSASAGAARKSLLQLAALEDMLECLSTHSPHLRQSIYAQDPAFVPLDVAFLATLGVTVLSVPEASARVGRGTVLFAPHCVRGVYLDALGAGPGGRGGREKDGDGGEVEEGAGGDREEDEDGGERGEEGGRGRGEKGIGGGGPALVVGNDVGALINGTIETPPSMMQTGKAFLEVNGRRSVAFPRFAADETVFWDMRIYWRERDTEEEEERGLIEQER